MLLDYRADAPTELYESSVVQWEWLHNYCSHCDQFNGIHETLIEAWKSFGLWGHRVHFACSRDAAADLGPVDRKSAVSGRTGAVRVDLGGRLIIKKKRVSTL